MYLAITFIFIPYTRFDSILSAPYSFHYDHHICIGVHCYIELLEGQCRDFKQGPVNPVNEEKVLIHNPLSRTKDHKQAAVEVGIFVTNCSTS